MSQSKPFHSNVTFLTQFSDFSDIICGRKPFVELWQLDLLSQIWNICLCPKFPEILFMVRLRSSCTGRCFQKLSSNCAKKTLSMIYVYNCILNQCYYICFYGQKLTTFHTTMTINHHLGAIKVGGQDGMRLASGC